MGTLRPLASLVGTLLALGTAGACAAVALLVLIPPRPPLDTVALLADYEARLRYAGGAPRPRLDERVRARVRRRLTLAGKHHWSLRRFALVSLLSGVGGAVAGLTLLGAPAFATVGFVVGVYGLWAWLGRLAERRELRLARQVAQMLLLIAGASAAGIPPLRILREVLPRATQPPLRDTLEYVLRRADPRRGLATVGFADLVADLDERLESNAFGLARAALEESVAEGADLSASLETIATLARRDLTFRLQVRATFATVRGTALVIVAFPLATTLLMRLADPALVAAAYSSPLGYGIVALVAGASAGVYRLVTASQRRAARAATGRPV